jgi:leader peptidase (prepilin peptidase)/N-methyltransferase
MDPLRLVVAAAALGVGACVGSFVNVLIWRLPRERSVVLPGSHCFCCGTPLAARDLVPVFSYLLGGRRCRYCGVPLGAQYAVVEALCALLYAALAWRWGPSATFVAYAVACAAMLAAFGTDLWFKIIPNALNQTLLLTGLLGAVARGWWPTPREAGLPTLGQAVLGAAVGWLVFETVVRLGRWWFGQEAMGGGDVLLAGGIGALLGPGRWFGAFFLLSILTGALVGGGLLLTGRLKRREPMPFGPFMVLGALAVMLWPELGGWVAGLYGFRAP